MPGYKVLYARSVVDFMEREVTSRRVYERIDEYRAVLAVFPEIGSEYRPYYEAAEPPFPCRCIFVPGTPFTLYYAIDESQKAVKVFAIESQRGNPAKRFGEK